MGMFVGLLTEILEWNSLNDFLNEINFSKTQLKSLCFSQ